MEDLNINIWNIIILMGIIQGIIFGLVILFNKKYYSKTNSFLAYTSFSLSFSNLQYWIIDSNLEDLFPFLGWFRIPCEFLIIPMFYLFVNKYLGVNVKKEIKISLLIPFFIDFLFQISISLDQLFFENKFISFKFIDTYMTIEEISSNSYSLFLIILTLLIVKNFEHRNNVFKIEFVKQKTKWLKQILIIGLSACVIWIAEIYLMQDITIDGKNTDVSLSIYYPIWMIISIIIYWLSYVGLFQSNLHVERIEIRNKIISEKNDIMYYVDETKKKNKGLKQEKKFTEFQDIISKNYMNPNLNLNEVSLMLNISSNYLSQIISNNNISFNDYLNSVRVENVKLKLNDSNYSNYTITSIGLESGFNSNASFYRAFRKHTGISPTTFKKNTH